MGLFGREKETIRKQEKEQKRRAIQRGRTHRFAEVFRKIAPTDSQHPDGSNRGFVDKH